MMDVEDVDSQKSQNQLGWKRLNSWSPTYDHLLFCFLPCYRMHKAFSLKMSGSLQLCGRPSFPHLKQRHGILDSNPVMTQRPH